MSVSIRGCPACSAMVIGDSPSCPHCGHVFDASRAASEFLDLIPSGEIELSEAEDEQPCKQCGEKVRVGLVRCWHCGAFTNSDIEATYHKMQAKPSQIMYSDVADEADRVPEKSGKFVSIGDDDGGFELDVQYGVKKEAAEDDFSIAPSISPVSTQSQTADSGSEYQLAIPAADNKDTTGQDQAATSQATYDQAAYDQQAYEQQYQTPWGYKLSADGTAWEIDLEVWHQAGYDPYAQPGEPGYYDPNQLVEGYAAATALEESAPIPELPGTEATAAGASAELPPPPDVAHSVSTGGEALFAAALEEEKDSVRLRKLGNRRKVTAEVTAPGTFKVFCPNGHRVQVHERHRGRAGRCPSCKAVFFVPVATAEAAPAEGAAAAPTGPQNFVAGAYTDWMFELRLHTINPQKLKLKPGAMAAEYDVADIAFSDKDMLVAMVFKRAGTFAAMQEKKKKPATREAMSDYLQTSKPASGLPVPFQTLVTKDDFSLLKIVQPSIPGEESIFAGIPVFGDGRIVVRLPAVLEGNSRVYISFSLSEFREFARLLEKVFGVVYFGQELGIPLSDMISTYKCHYSEIELPTLDRAEYYLPDPALKPIILGRRCAGCGLVVSEDARKKEKIGGKNDASIAKATCPKCKKKFGDITLYGLNPDAKPVVFGQLPVEK